MTKPTLPELKSFFNNVRVFGADDELDCANRHPASNEPTEWEVMKGALEMQGRVIGALILREMQTKYGRENIGYLWALVEPVIFLSMFLAIYYYHGRVFYNGMNMVSFLATGIMTFLSIRKISSSIASATDANKGLLLYPQVTPIDTMLARVVLESATFIVVFSLIIGMGWLLDYAALPEDYFGVLIALFAAALLAVSLGLLQDVILTLFPVCRHIMGPFWRFLFFTSCTVYTLRDMPVAVQKIMAYNPITHVIELLRSAYFVSFKSQIQDYNYVIIWCAGCMFVGLLVERMYRHKDLDA